MLNEYPLLLEKNEKNCNNYISDIKFKKKFTKIKAIITLIYNLLLFLYFIFRIRNLKIDCLIDILFSILIIVGYFLELVIVSINLSNYNKTDFDSENFSKCNRITGYYHSIIDKDTFEGALGWSYLVIAMDKGIISIVCIYIFPIFINCLLILCGLADSYDKLKCIDENFSFIESCGKCCAICCGNDNDSLKKKNEGLSKRIKNLEKENNNLKRQNEEANNLNNLMTERNKLEEEKIISNNKKFSEENANLKNKIIDYENQIFELKTDNNNLNEELKELKNIITKNSEEKQNKSKIIEEKQLKVIEYYLKKDKEKDLNNNNNNNNNNKSFLKILLLKEINEEYGIFLDSENFKKIALYYIKSKLTELLTDQNNSKLLSDPVIQEDGITLSRNNAIKCKNFVENKLVAKIIEILEKNKDLQLIDFTTIKVLLKNVKTNNYYNNPVVVINGNKKGETIERDSSKNIYYINIVIKNIINKLKEFFEDDFFNFEGLENEDMKRFVNYNNIIAITFVSGDGLINHGIKCLKTETFAEVEEKLYKIYDKYRKTNNTFLHNGDVVMKFKTIEENKIKDGDKIVLQII